MRIFGAGATVMGVMVVAVSAAFAVEPPEGPLGYGIFLHLQYPARVRGIPVSLMEHPLVDGARYSFNWAELEPQEGQYRWDLIGKMLSEWAARGKRVIIAVKTAQKGGEGETAHSATPEWVYAAGAEKIAFEAKRGPAEGETIVYPVYWDPIYLAKYERFIRALANRFDGDPRIEYVEIGVGQGGAIKVAAEEGALKLFQTQANPPYTPERFVEATKKVIDATDAAFSKTPKALFLNTFFKQKDGTEKKEMPELARYATDQGFYLFSRSLDGSPRAMVERGYAAVFHELGPKTKTAFAYDFNIVKDPEKNPGHSYEQSLAEFRAYMRHAIGGATEREAGREGKRKRKHEGGGATYTVPTTYLNYLLLLHRDAALMDPQNPSRGPMGYERQIEDEVRRVRDHLRKTPPPHQEGGR